MSRFQAAQWMFERVFLLDFVAFFHVASLLSCRGRLWKSGVGNEKALELVAWKRISFEHFRLFSWTISKIFSRLTAFRISVKLFSNIPQNFLNWFHIQTTKKSCWQTEMSCWIQAAMQQDTYYVLNRVLIYLSVSDREMHSDRSWMFERGFF